MYDFYKGAFDAFTFVLNYLNTLENKEVDKTKIYSEISKMRPNHLPSWSNYSETS